ncbi:MAG: radical SAM protein [Elusimicrobia bacterium]|nr:radical SAM protein [Elusimicrobiota bacterium]
MKTSILFIALPKKLPPFSLLALASYINQRTEHTAGILDLNGRKDAEEAIAERLKLDPPGLVGFSCFTCDYPEVMRLSKLVEKSSGCRVVVGNVHASLYPEDFIFSGSPVDFVVRGEGELTLAELLDKLAAGRSPAGLAGAAAHGPGGTMLLGEKRPLIADLGVLPRIDYGMVAMEPYLAPANRGVPGFPARTGTVYTSRGCPSNCEFCAANTVWKCNTGPSVRFRPIEDVMLEVGALKAKYGIQCVAFGDDSFLIKKSRVLAFCEAIRKLDIFWSVQGRVEHITSEVVSAMRGAGCVMIGFGVESGSDAILKRINKGITTAQIRNAFAVCRAQGCARMAYIMCNHPGETEKDVELTVRLLREIRPDGINQAVLTPYPGTAIYAKYVGKKPENFWLFSNIGPELAGYFKLCEHDLPLNRVLDSYWLAVYARRLPVSLTAVFREPRYLSRVLLSRYALPVMSVIAADTAVWLRYLAVASIPWPIRNFLRACKHRIEAVFK